MIIFAYLFVDDTPSIRSKRAITSTLRASLHLVEQCLYSIVCYCYSIVFFLFYLFVDGIPASRRAVFTLLFYLFVDGIS